MGGDGERGAGAHPYGDGGVLRLCALHEGGEDTGGEGQQWRAIAGRGEVHVRVHGIQHLQQDLHSHSINRGGEGNVRGQHKQKTCGQKG